MRLKTISAASTAALVSLGGIFLQSAHAALIPGTINMQMGNGYGISDHLAATYTGSSAASLGTGGSAGFTDTGTVWNNFRNETTGTATVDSGGVTLSTPATLSVTFAGTHAVDWEGFEWGTPSATTSDPSNLLDFASFQKNINPYSIATFTISGLTASAYDVYIYAQDGTQNDAKTTTYTINGNTLSAANTSADDDVFTDGVNYVVFDAVPTTGSITGSFTESSIGFLNGITLVPVPEPASLGLLSLGALGLLRRRRKQV